MEQVADVVSVRVAGPRCHPARDGDATKLGKRTRSNHKFGHSGSNANGRWHGIAQRRQDGGRQYEDQLRGWRRAPRAAGLKARMRDAA